MKDRGVLSLLMLVLITVMGLTNFFAPLFTDYKTDPIVTYIFMGVASGIAGYKGFAATYLLHKIKPPDNDRQEQE